MSQRSNGQTKMHFNFILIVLQIHVTFVDPQQEKKVRLII